MSSSGLIYAGIVGAWAVYLVPVWLRREEQLNEARQKARYAAAIRTLGRSERFEKKVLAAETLAATGTDGAPAVGGPLPRPGRKAAEPAKTLTPTETPATDRTAEAAKPKAKTSAAAQGRKGVTAHLPHAGSRPGTRPGTASSGARTASAANAANAATAAAKAARRRGVLLMRRRRVVAFLFTLATFGAVVSAILGVAYIWAMLAPAALFSGYIVYIRRDERQRAKERFRRRQAALAAERRRERQRTAESPAPRVPAVAEPESSVWRPLEHPQEYRRAANG